MTRLEAFLEAADWRPIAAYDRDAGETVVFRSGSRFNAGYFGSLEIWSYADGSNDYVNRGEPTPDVSPMFRAAQDWRDGQPLGWEPTEFAEIGEDEDVWADLLSD